MDTLHHQGEIIGDRYQIVTSLGQGGMGTTYAAVDLENHQRVAIKAVSLRQVQDWKIVELFEREAKVLATLKHPAIPQYLDYFHCDTESDRYFYLVQELVEGESLAALVKRGWKVTEKQVKYIATQILEILKYLHSFRPPIIHRDIKPQNIIVRPDGKVYLVDFGAVQEIYRNTLSFSGTFVGTMGYISPEQFRGKVIPASDLYSLGCTLLFVLTRRSPADLPQKRMRFDFRDRFSLSSEFADWLEKMVEPAREDRFLSANQAMKALQQKHSSTAVKKTFLQTSYHFQKIQKPKNTRVILKRSDRELSISIPPSIDLSKLKRSIYFLIFFVLLLIIAYIVSSDFQYFYWRPLLFFVLFMIMLIIFSVGGFYFDWIYQKTDLNINPYWFSITQSSLISNYTIKGKTKEITSVELQDTTFEGGTNFSCVVWEGDKMREFGKILNTTELIWIVDEIHNFLAGVHAQVVESNPH